jgi:hypothetical protein
MKHVKQVHGNGSSKSPRRQTQNPGRKPQNPHSPLPVTLSLTPAIVELAGRAAQAEGTSPDELMGEAIRVRLQAWAKVEAAKKTGKESKWAMRRDARALFHLVHRGLVKFGESQEQPARPATAPGVPGRRSNDGMFRLEENVYTAAGVIQLLAASLAEYQNVCGNEAINHAACGTQHLAWRTINNLMEAFRAGWKDYRSAAAGADTAADTAARTRMEGGVR